MNKIILECENGHQWEPMVRELAGEGTVSLSAPCPLCHPPEPRYGDLDVEMVAKWLQRVTAQAKPGEAYRTMSRAVIRLANDVWERAPLGSYCKHPTGNLAAWLDCVGKGEE